MLDAFHELADRDPDFIVLTGDLGFGVFESFQIKFPKQFFNIGIAEQNMIGIASGLALEGKKIFVYSIGNFPTMRCLEQIRNDACYHELNINIVCQGGGFTYGSLGMSHHATEDLAIMRALPGITVVAPLNGMQAKSAVFHLYDTLSVGYLRLEKEEKNIPISNMFQNFQLSRAEVLREGSDLAIIGCGSILNEALIAANELENHGISCKILNMHTIKPIDKEAIIEIAQRNNLIITLEEHNIIGGLGSAVCEIIAEHELSVKVKRMGLNDCYSNIVGDQCYLRNIYRLNAKYLEYNILQELLE